MRIQGGLENSLIVRLEVGIDLVQCLRKSAVRMLPTISALQKEF
jgi:hypothetical protein